MAKYASIVQGPRARKTIELPRPGATFDAETATWKGPTVKLDVRALRGDEHDRVLSDARAYAKKLGAENPVEGDELFERGRIVHTLAIACIDTDSPKDAPAPFFEGGVEEILGADELTPELIAYLYEQQQIHQDEVSPLLKSMSPAEFAVAVMQTAAGENGDMSFFVSSRPGMRWSFTLSMAKLLASSTMLASLSSSGSEPQPATTRG
jgi:hypothetical protein